VGDFVIDRTGVIWICTVAGSPGTWVNPSANAGVTSLNSLAGALSITAGTNVTVTPSGSNIQIDATGGTGWNTVATCATDRTTTSLTLGDVPDLNIALTSGKMYEVQCIMQIANNTSAGTNWAFNYSGSMTGEWIAFATSNQVGAGTNAGTYTGVSHGPSVTSTADGLIWMQGMILPSTSGNLTAQFARVSPSLNSTVRGGSSLKVRIAL